MTCKCYCIAIGRRDRLHALVYMMQHISARVHCMTIDQRLLNNA